MSSIVIDYRFQSISITDCIDTNFYRLTTPGGLPGRLHISINTKYQGIKVLLRSNY